jgi:flavin reductase (DIM6/NTAB) family NADH-FMN oxidoreductase RutF
VIRPDLDGPTFRQLLSRFATGVTVLTTRDLAGFPVGMTASSLTSVSLTPPLVSVCVDVTADMHRALGAGPPFVINILGAGQEALSRRFAVTPAAERFTGLPYRETEDGLVILEGVVAHIECEKFTEVPLGDHTLFVGRVTGGSMSEADPLLYYRGSYGALHRE